MVTHPEAGDPVSDSHAHTRHRKSFETRGVGVTSGDDHTVSRSGEEEEDKSSPH